MPTTAHNADAGLFVVFIVTILVLFLVPMTIHRVFFWEEEDESKVKKRGTQKPVGRLSRIKTALTPYTVILIIAWIIAALMIWYVSTTTASQDIFDPYKVLGITVGATEAEIKRAYRKMTLEYHPDRNPDPRAQEQFLEITKAEKILTDPEARANWEKYGNPDGPQGYNVGIPLPPIMVFLLNDDGDLGTITLMGLVALFILTPICAVIGYLWWSQKRTANNINHMTLKIFWTLLKDKESLALKFVPGIIANGIELQEISYRPDHVEALDSLRKSLRKVAEDKEFQKQDWLPHPVTNAKLIFLAQMYREEIPKELEQVAETVLTRTEKLINEFMTLALLPRPPRGYGWLRPAQSTIEFSQSLVQRIRPKVLSGMEKNLKKPAVALLQLAGVEEDTLKKLKNKKVRSMKDLQEMEEEEARMVLRDCGIKGEDLDNAIDTIQYYPEISADIIIETEGEESIVEGDVSVLKMRILLKRPALPKERFATGRNLQKETKCICPRYPLNRSEAWWVFLCDQKENRVLRGERLTIPASDEWYEGKDVEGDNEESVLSNGASDIGITQGQKKTTISFADDLEEEEGEEEEQGDDDENKTNGEKPENDVEELDESKNDNKDDDDDDDDDIEIPDKVEEIGTALPPGGKHYKTQFQAPGHGTHTFSVLIMSDCWVNVDFEQNVKIKIEKRSKAGLRRGAADDDDSQAIDEDENDDDIFEDDSDYENEDEED